MNSQLCFITSNESKMKEAQLILDFPIEIVKLELEEIQDFDIKRVVTQKALEAYKQIQKPLFVDDVGFYVEEWNHFPGPFIKFLLASGGNELLLKMLGNAKNRNAYCVSAIGFHDGKTVHTFIGKVSGHIPYEPKGTINQHGFNAIFIPDGSEKTYSEMSHEDKSNLSHRRKSLEMFKKYLEIQKKEGL